MNKLIKLYELFNSGQLAKSLFIEAAATQHNILFEYAELLSDSVISKIEISANQVVAEIAKYNIKINIRADDIRTAPLEALNFKSYETAETSLLIKLGNKCRVFFDVGANIGWFSLILAKSYPDLSIHCFEPVPSSFFHLEQNIKLNGLKNIKINHLGLANMCGIACFNVDPNLSVNASLRNLAKSENIEKINCKVTTLDNYFLSCDPVLDLIKCDVEGAELLVIQGGLETIKSRQPIIFAELLRKWSKEFNYHPNEVIKLLRETGYDCWAISNETLTPICEITDNTLSTNFLFTHREKHKLNKLLN